MIAGFLSQHTPPRLHTFPAVTVSPLLSPHLLTGGSSFSTGEVAFRHFCDLNEEISSQQPLDDITDPFPLPPSPFTHPKLSSNHQITVATRAFVCTRAGSATIIHLFQEAKAIHFWNPSNRQLPDMNHTQHNQANTWVLRYGLPGLNLKHKA